MRKAKDAFVIAALVVCTALLASCTGSKERASAEDLKNHIENLDVEKVPMEDLRKIEDRLNFDHGQTVLSQEGDVMLAHEDQLTTITEDSSNVIVDVTLNLRGPDNSFVTRVTHVEVDKATGIATLFSDGEVGQDVLKSQKFHQVMVVNKDGEIVKDDNYTPGAAADYVKTVANQASIPTVNL
ncbi:MAG: hypothetical protein JWM20_993 [Patescibacteria group bacterium]|nr:hypothetical protein [Patescibacteria group bacterium]